MALSEKLSQALTSLKTLIYQRTKVDKDTVVDRAYTAYLNEDINIDMTASIEALTEADLHPTEVFARSYINQRKIAQLTGNVALLFDATEKTWMDYVTGYSIVPIKLFEDTDYIVYQYDYSDTSRLYRKISKIVLEDAFYESYEDDILSGLVVAKQL